MKYAINLFPKQKSDVAERSMYFIANYMRYALVLSLLIVIVIFFLRMRLDQQLVEEKEKLMLKRSIVVATKDLQADLNTAQYKIKIVQGLLTNQDLFYAKFDYINSVVPRRATVTTLTIEANKISLDGTCQDYHLIQAFAAKLRKDGRFGKVALSKVARDKGSYSFSVQLDGFKEVAEEEKAKS